MKKFTILILFGIFSFSAWGKNSTSKKEKNLDQAVISLKFKEDEKFYTVSTRNFSLYDLNLPFFVSFSELFQNLSPSFHATTSFISDGSDVVKPVTFRGLSPDQTLVLINGKRYHYSALLHINGSIARGTSGVDFNSIPQNSVKGIQIFNGSSSVYGSGAIAGVINLDLKDDTKGYFSTRYGLSSRRDGQIAKLSWEKGYALNSGGVVSLAYEFLNQGDTDRSGIIGAENYDRTAGALDEKEESFNRKSMRVGQPKLNQHSLVVNSKIYVDSKSNFYNFLIFSHRDAVNNGFYRLAKDEMRNVKEVYPDGFLPSINSKVTDISFALGFNRNLQNGWFSDLSYVFSHNKLHYGVIDSINASHAASLTTNKASTPREADSGAIALNSHIINYDMSKKIESDFSLAFGLELRRQNYQIIAGEELSYKDYDGSGGKTGGIQVFPGFRPENEVDENRDNLGIYIQAKKSFLKDIDLMASMRFENYDSFGNTVVGSISSLYKVSDRLSFNLALNTGFRAPSIQQEFFNATSTLVQAGGVLSQTGTFRTDSPIAKGLGVPNLKEESSHSFNLNLSYQPLDNVFLNFGYYFIDINDRVALSSSVSKGSDTEIDRILTDNEIEKAQFFLNLGNTQTNGLDFSLSYNSKVAEGELRQKLNISWVQSLVDKVNNPPGELSGLNLISERDISIIEDWDPNFLASFLTSYEFRDWIFNLIFQYYGPYEVNDGGLQEYSGELITNLSCEYKIKEDLQLTFGINNLFDVFPDENKIGNSRGGEIEELGINSPGVFRYSRRSLPFGTTGALFFANLSYSF